MSDSKFGPIRRAMTAKQISSLKGEKPEEDKEQELLQALYNNEDDESKKERIRKLAERQGLEIK